MNESSIKALQAEVKKLRGDETMIQNSPVESSASNGSVERAIREVDGTVRTAKLALEEHIGRKVMVNEDIFSRMVEHAADSINRYKVGKDGRTPRQRLLGRKDCPRITEFRELVVFMPQVRKTGKESVGSNFERRSLVGP